MEATRFEDFDREIRDTHVRMRPIFEARPITGKRIAIPREGKEPVDVILHAPAQRGEDKLPVVCNMHGGGFVGGDAVLLDSFCQMLAQGLPAIVLNINYRKAPEHPFPYAIEEVYDVLAHVCRHADEYGADPLRMALCGQSAGASLAAAAALKAKEEGAFAPVCQVLVYPATDLHTGLNPEDDPEIDLEPLVAMYCPNGESGHRWASPLLAKDEELEGVCPAIFITCELDVLRQQGEAYAKRLIDLGVPVTLRRYPGALHGFLEVNRPDSFFDDERKTPQQQALCLQAEAFILAQLKAWL